MLIHPHSGTGWRRWCAFLCLAAIVFSSVAHGAHIYPQRLSPKLAQTEIAVSSPASTLCLTCEAIQASATVPVFRAVAVSTAVGAYPPVVDQNPRISVRFFRLLVRPPPAA
jgi:hypothetical protein